VRGDAGLAHSYSTAMCVTCLEPLTATGTRQSGSRSQSVRSEPFRQGTWKCGYKAHWD